MDHHSLKIQAGVAVIAKQLIGKMQNNFKY